MTTSWVIVSRETGQAVLETFSPKVVAAINLDRYTVVPIMAYLQTLNRTIRAARERERGTP